MGPTDPTATPTDAPAAGAEPVNQTPPAAEPEAPAQVPEAPSTGAEDARGATEAVSAAAPAAVSSEAVPAADAGPSPAVPTTLSTSIADRYGAIEQRPTLPEPAVSPIKPTVGRIVLVTLRSQYDRIETRPAIIVHVFERNDGQTPLVNLQVFLDGANDQKDRTRGDLLWMTSAHYDPAGAPHTWRWMDYQKGQAAKNDGAVAFLHAQVMSLLNDLAETRRQLASFAARAGHHLD